MPSDADAVLAEQLRALRREYLAASDARIEELKRLRTELARGSGVGALGLEPLNSLRQAFHRLAGSGGSYGFPQISVRSREGETLVQNLAAAAAPLSSADLRSIDGAIESVAAAFSLAAQQASPQR